MVLSNIQVTPQKEKQFATRGITSVEDLLFLMPHKYDDLSRVTGVLDSSEISCFYATVEAVRINDGKTGTYVMAVCKELGAGRGVRVYWFGQGWMYQQARAYTGKTVVIAGKVDVHPTLGLSVRQPKLFGADNLLRIYPVYKTIKGMSADYLTGKIGEAMKIAGLDSEMLPRDLVNRTGALSMPVALRYIHTPNSMEETQLGTERVLLNDLTYFALHNELNRNETASTTRFQITDTTLMQRMVQSLPFTLTADQAAALDAMVRSATTGERINALVQGDVGCGKTVISALLAAALIGSGYQVVLMAPTQVLAKQHLASMVDLFAPLGVDVLYLDGTLKAKEKKEVLAKIRGGSVGLVVGTHACIGKAVEYSNLALTIVDEEHKFGVAQRAAIVAKAADGVHNLTMSATPIPRSLATVVYGESIQLHTIQTMPAGRKPVITGINTKREKLYRFLAREINAGHQAYVVCPLIEKSDSERMASVQSVEMLGQRYADELSQHGVRVATLTGRDTKADTEAVLSSFYAGDIDVLVATTVVEVGVNVPNATVMVIESAERFGLSQLHQLRGRVGRGNDQSYCVLCSDALEDPSQVERLKVLCDTTDGFKIAEEDLRLRGAGDLLGTQQSGENKYIPLLLAYPKQYEVAKDLAREIIRRGLDCCPMGVRVAKERSEGVEAS